MQRVVITGMGCVSALGLSAGATWQAMREGRPGIAPLTGLSGADIAHADRRAAARGTSRRPTSTRSG